MAEFENLSKDMIDVLRRVLPYILGEDGDVWGWYPKADRTDSEGNSKYNGFVFYERKMGVSEVRYIVFHEEGDIEARFRILEAKAGSVSSSSKASICARNLDANPPIYGGASLCNPNERDEVWIYAGSGAPELVDHLVICCLQWFAGKISFADYTERTDLDYPGIRAAMEQVGMHAGIYMSMKASIEARFIADMKANG